MSKWRRKSLLGCQVLCQRVRVIEGGQQPASPEGALGAFLHVTRVHSRSSLASPPTFWRVRTPGLCSPYEGEGDSSHLVFIREAVIPAASVSLLRAKRKSERGSLGVRGCLKGQYADIPEALPAKLRTPRESSRNPKAGLIILPQRAGTPELVEGLSTHTRLTMRPEQNR